MWNQSYQKLFHSPIIIVSGIAQTKKRVCAKRGRVFSHSHINLIDHLRNIINPPIINKYSTSSKSSLFFKHFHSLSLFYKSILSRPQTYLYSYFYFLFFSLLRVVLFINSDICQKKIDSSTAAGIIRNQRFTNSLTSLSLLLQ